jgi:hypothetical protein
MPLGVSGSICAGRSASSASSAAAEAASSPAATAAATVTWARGVRVRGMDCRRPCSWRTPARGVWDGAERGASRSQGGEGGGEERQVRRRGRGGGGRAYNPTPRGAGERRVRKGEAPRRGRGTSAWSGDRAPAKPGTVGSSPSEGTGRPPHTRARASEASTSAPRRAR